MTKLNRKIKNLDFFGFQFGFAYNNESQYKTLFGGWVSLIITIIIIWQSLDALYLMAFHKNDQINVNEELLDFESLGQVDIDRLEGGIPFYALLFNSHFLKIHSKEHCNGNCFDRLEKMLDIYWE